MGPYETMPGPWARWILFPAANDSLEFYAAPVALGLLPYAPNIVMLQLQMAAKGIWRETLRGVTDAPFVRYRFLAAGTTVLEFTFEGGVLGDPGNAFDVRVVQIAASPASRLARARARLTIGGDSTERVAIVPASVGAHFTATDYRAWAVSPGDYGVLLVRDSLYEMCKLPCARVDAVHLRDGVWARWP